MTRTIAQRELRNDNAGVIEAVVAGEDFIVTRNGIPVAELRPIATQRRTLVQKSQLVEIAGSGPRVDAKQLRADLDNIIDPNL